VPTERWWHHTSSEGQEGHLQSEKDAYVSMKDAYVSTKDAYVSAKDAYVSAKDTQKGNRAKDGA
jgi:hypothetical protein